MRLMVRNEVREDAVVVRVEGEVDTAVADELGSHLRAGLDTALAHPGRSLIIDLQTAAFFASAGFNAVLRCHDEWTGNGVGVCVVTANPIIVRVLEVTRLDEVLTIYPTIDEALGPRDGGGPV